jgi:hypothetical protein
LRKAWSRIDGVFLVFMWILIGCMENASLLTGISIPHLSRLANVVYGQEISDL